MLSYIFIEKDDLPTVEMLRTLVTKAEDINNNAIYFRSPNPKILKIQMELTVVEKLIEAIESDEPDVKFPVVWSES